MLKKRQCSPHNPSTYTTRMSPPRGVTTHPVEDGLGVGVRVGLLQQPDGRQRQGDDPHQQPRQQRVQLEHVLYRGVLVPGDRRCRQSLCISAICSTNTAIATVKRRNQNNYISLVLKREKI